MYSVVKKGDYKLLNIQILRIQQLQYSTNDLTVSEGICTLSSVDIDVFGPITRGAGAPTHHEW